MVVGGGLAATSRGFWDGLIEGIGRLLGTRSDTAPQDEYRDIYRAIGPRELDYLNATGNYGLSRNASGKYFALTLGGAYDFANSPFNAGTQMTVTQTSVPVSILNSGFLFNDVGGAGPSVHFSDSQLPQVYFTMTRPVILPRTP